MDENNNQNGGLKQGLKDSAKQGLKNGAKKAGKTLGKKLLKLIGKIIFSKVFIILVLVTVLLAAFTWFLEQKTHKDASDSLQDTVKELTEGSSPNKIVSIEGDKKEGYYYQFVDKLWQQVIEKLEDSNTHYIEMNLKRKDESVLKQFMIAQLITQLPDLTGKNDASVETTVSSVIDASTEVTDSVEDATGTVPDINGNYTVAIMAGHDVNSPGASNGSLKEEEMTRKVAKYVEDIFSSNSKIKVVQVGSTIENPAVPNEGRLQAARDANAHLLVGIHFNSAESSSANGVSICYNDTKSAATEKLGNILKTTVAESMGLGTANDYAKPLVTIGGADEAFPSVIVEGGFLTGDKDYSALVNGGDSILQKYAQGIVNGVCEYLNTQ